MPTQRCKGCGLDVTPGYPRCPRCRMPLPAAQTPLAATSRAHDVQGGTSVEESSGSSLWLGLVAVLLVGAGVAVFAIPRGGDAPAEAASVDTNENVAEAEAPDLAEAPSAPAQPAPEAADHRVAALEDLESTLNGASLWSKVTAADSTGTVVSVRSASCDGREIRSVLEPAKGALAVAGFTKLQCIAEHGELLFELDL